MTSNLDSHIFVVVVAVVVAVVTMASLHNFSKL